MGACKYVRTYVCMSVQPFVQMVVGVGWITKKVFLFSIVIKVKLFTLLTFKVVT